MIMKLFSFSRESKVTSRYLPRTYQRDLSVKTTVQNNLTKPNPSKKFSSDVSRNSSFNKKIPPSSLSKKIEPSNNTSLKNNKKINSPKRVDSRVSSPVPPKRIGSPSPKINKSPTHRLNKTPTPTSNRSPTPKATVTSPTKRNGPSTKSSQSSSRHTTKATTPSTATEPKTTMQRSSTFLKEKPTVLNKAAT